MNLICKTVSLRTYTQVPLGSTENNVCEPFVRHQESRPLGRSNTRSPRFTDFPSLCACSESSLTNLSGWEYQTITPRMLRKLDLPRRPRGSEAAILSVDQKERGLWGRARELISVTSKRLFCCYPVKFPDRIWHSPTRATLPAGTRNRWWF